MVVLVAPTPSTQYVRLALLVNGFAMIAGSRRRVREGNDPPGRGAASRREEVTVRLDDLADLWALGLFCRRRLHLVRGSAAQGGGAARLMSRRGPLHGDLRKIPRVAWPWLLRRGRLGQCYPRLPLARRNCVGLRIKK